MPEPRIAVVGATGAVGAVTMQLLKERGYGQVRAFASGRSAGRQLEGGLVVEEATPETLAALGGITTFRTDRDGTVEVSLDGPGLVVRAHANGLPPPRRGSVPYAPARR